MYVARKVYLLLGDKRLEPLIFVLKDLKDGSLNHPNINFLSASISIALMDMLE